MEEPIEIRLNNFLFNSGILGLLRILNTVEKEEYYEFDEKQTNVVLVNPKVFETFTDDYFKAFLINYGENTRWHTLVDKKETIRTMKLDTKEQQDKFKEEVKRVKNAMESASYQSGYETIKEKEEENPYDYVNELKKTKELEQQRKWVVHILDYLQKHKEIYCMKDIIYNKINLFWENLAFLNRQSNKKDMKEEYQKTFVNPVVSYLQNKQKTNQYNCIECGNLVSKQQIQSLSFLEDMGIDINRKKSGFWDFKEDAFICPICALIYSCVPMGFNMVGSTGLFINASDSIRMLVAQNEELQKANYIDKNSVGERYQMLFKTILQKQEEIKANYEISNIQVVKRQRIEKDKIKYQFNQIGKDKLLKFMELQKSFTKLLNCYIRLDDKTIMNIYDQVLDNFLNNQSQYHIIDQLIRKQQRADAIGPILQIELKKKEGENMKQLEERIEDTRKAGRELQRYFVKNKENENKLKAYILKLANTLRAGNVGMFMDLLTRMYGSLGQSIPFASAFEEMIKNPESFQLLGYSYLLGLEQYLGEQEENKGGNENE